MRLLNLILAAISVLLGAYLSSSGLNIDVWITALSVLMITAGGNLINDFFDRELDKINKSSRLFITDRISPDKLLLISAVLFLSGETLLFFVGFDLVYLGLISIGLLIIYTPFLKPHPLIGNIAVSILLSLTLLAGYMAVSGDFKNIIFPMIFVFLINFPREILKDVEDIIGDRENNLRTFPIVFGTEKSRKLVNSLLIVLIISILIAIREYGLSFSVCVLSGVCIPVAIMIYRSRNSPEWFRRCQRILKMTMPLGMIALLVSKIPQW